MLHENWKGRSKSIYDVLNGKAGKNNAENSADYVELTMKAFRAHQ